MFLINLLVILSLLLFRGHPAPIPATNPSVTNVKAASTYRKPPYPTIASAGITAASPSGTKRTYINCLGPDKKHFFATQEDCVAFQSAWSSPNTQGTTSSAWGVAQKVGEHTYTMKFFPDAKQATPQEVLHALNSYRHIKGVGELIWSQALADYAATRAESFAEKKSLDAHTGFLDYVNNQNGFVKLGFSNLGENAAYAGPVNGVHLIEWIFAGDTEHDSNQLSTTWTYVGIGLVDKGVAIIFGGNKRN